MIKIDAKSVCVCVESFFINSININSGFDALDEHSRLAIHYSFICMYVCICMYYEAKHITWRIWKRTMYTGSSTTSKCLFCFSPTSRQLLLILSLSTLFLIFILSVALYPVFTVRFDAIKQHKHTVLILFFSFVSLRYLLMLHLTIHIHIYHLHHISLLLLPLFQIRWCTDIHHVETHVNILLLLHITRTIISLYLYIYILFICNIVINIAHSHNTHFNILFLEA